MEQALRRVRIGAGFRCTRGFAMTVGARRRAIVLDHFEHLAFDDAADAIQVGAALAFDRGVVERLPAQPEKYPQARKDYETRQRNQVLPIGEKVSQRKYLSARGRSHKRVARPLV